MSNLPLEVVEMLGQTMAKIAPVTIGLAVAPHFWACNPGRPWWRKPELITDIRCWFFVTVFAREFRVGLLVISAGVVFRIHDADALIAFFDNGHRSLSELPLWARAMLFLVASDCMLYWACSAWFMAASRTLRRSVRNGLLTCDAAQGRQSVPRHPQDPGHR